MKTNILTHHLPAVRKTVTAWSVLRWVLYPLFPVVYLVAFVFRVLTWLIPAAPDRTQERYTGYFGSDAGKPIESDTEAERRASADFMTYPQLGNEETDYQVYVKGNGE